MARATTKQKEAVQRTRATGPHTATPHEVKTGADRRQESSKLTDPKTAIREKDGRPVWFCRRPMGYGGDEFDRGEIIQLRGLVHDEKLVRLEFVLPVLVTETPVECGICHKSYISVNELQAHGHKRHVEKVRPPAPEPRQHGETAEDYDNRLIAHGKMLGRLEDQAAETEAAMTARLAPIPWDKTTAARTA